MRNCSRARAMAEAPAAGPQAADCPGGGATTSPGSPDEGIGGRLCSLNDPPHGPDVPQNSVSSHSVDAGGTQPRMRRGVSAAETEQLLQVVLQLLQAGELLQLMASKTRWKPVHHEG